MSQHITFLDRSAALDSISHLLPVRVELTSLQTLRIEDSTPHSDDSRIQNTSEQSEIRNQLILKDTGRDDDKSGAMIDEEMP